MKKDRLYDILETMKKNPLKAVLSHFGALSDHSAASGWVKIQKSYAKIGEWAVYHRPSKLQGQRLVVI